MENKFIKILILISILSFSLIRGNTHFISMSNMNLHSGATMSDYSQESKNEMKKNHNICNFMCHLVFIHTEKKDINTFISYNNFFYFNPNFHSLKIINIFKPPIYT